MAQKEAIMRALMEAMGGAPSQSLRPKMRPKGKPMRPKMRPEVIGNAPGSQGTRGIDPAENYSPEDLDRLLKGARGYMGGGKVEKYAKGGAVKKSAKKKTAKKPKNGCTMKGRGGSYKGMK